ncbi:MAG: purH [Naasia sp.]|nr:purH [Naasia sp.]
MSGPRIDPDLYRERDLVPLRRAIVSVSDKSGLLPFVSALAAGGVEIVSTGSTAAQLAAAGVPVTEVATVTGFPESLDGRVKTLHPAVHGGLLADLRLEDHERQLAELDIRPFDLAVVNLYPFAATVAAGAPAGEVVEQIDIGGPAMVRAAAKNHPNVAVVVSPDRYPEILEALAAGGTRLEQRRRLAAAAFAHTAAYDRQVADWMDEQTGDAERVLRVEATLTRSLRYGENAHQQAALYSFAGGRGIAQAEQLHGKEMSYNNYVDADAAVRAAYDFERPAVAIIKHANPCGIAVASGKAPDPIASAHIRAHECDPVSAFGGVIAANRRVTLGMAEQVGDVFTEVLIAPDFEPDALTVLRTKKNLRLLRLPADYRREGREFRQVSGGVLLQTTDSFAAEGGAAQSDSSAWTLVSGDEADPATRADLEFAWRACRAVKSNAILLAADGASVGVGMGQVNRVDSCQLAVSRAGDRARGSVAASDAFFPFADGLRVLLDAGVRAVVQPGGSVRDDEVIAAAAKAGVSMYFTGERHFAH